MKHGLLMWRVVAMVTSLLIAFLVMIFYGAIGYGSGIGWTYEVVVLAYPGIVFIGLVFWHRSTQKRPAAPLFRASAWITFLLPALLLIGWTGWIAGFGDAFISTINHIFLAAIPVLLIIFAYIIFFQSIRFAWVNVIFLGAIALLQAVIIQRSSTTFGDAFSSFSFDDMVIVVFISLVAAILALFNYLAIRKVSVYGEAEPRVYRFVRLWWGVGFLSLLVASLSTFGITARAVQEITQDASRDWSKMLTVHIENEDLVALRERLAQRRLGISIAPEALVTAANHGQPETVELLIEAGADIEGETIINYQTALTTAATRGDAQMIQTLLKHGANPNHGGEVYIPDEGRYIWITALSAAVLASDSESVEILLAAGATPDLTPGDGMTPLMRAAKLGDIKSLQLLLAAGANLNRQNSLMGWTALHYSAANEQNDVFKALLLAGADPDVQDQQGRTGEELLNSGRRKQ